MASTLHAATTTFSQPSFSQNSTDSTGNGVHIAQNQLNSFEASQSAISTPTPTPPASRVHQTIMPLNMANFGPPNGYYLQPATPRGLDVNGSIPQQRYAPGHKPQIYTVRELKSYRFDLRSFTDKHEQPRRYIQVFLFMRWR